MYYKIAVLCLIAGVLHAHKQEHDSIAPKRAQNVCKVIPTCLTRYAGNKISLIALPSDTNTPWQYFAKLANGSYELNIEKLGNATVLSLKDKTGHDVANIIFSGELGYAVQPSKDIDVCYIQQLESENGSSCWEPSLLTEDMVHPIITKYCAKKPMMALKPTHCEEEHKIGKRSCCVVCHPSCLCCIG